MLYLLVCLFRWVSALLFGSKKPSPPELIEPSRPQLRMEIAMYAAGRAVDADRLMYLFAGRIKFCGRVPRELCLIEDPCDAEARGFQEHLLDTFPDIVVSNECCYEYSRKVSARLRQTERRLSMCMSQAERQRAEETKRIVDVLLKSPLCPIGRCEMADPVVLACGHVFERSACAKWMHRDPRCPMCRAEIRILNL